MDTMPQAMTRQDAIEMFRDLFTSVERIATRHRLDQIAELCRKGQEILASNCRADQAQNG